MAVVTIQPAVSIYSKRQNERGMSTKSERRSEGYLGLRRIERRHDAQTLSGKVWRGVSSGASVDRRYYMAKHMG